MTRGTYRYWEIDFDKIKDLIPEGNLYDFISAALEKLGISPTKEMFTVRGIMDAPGLQALAAGILEKAWGTKAGVPTGFHEVIRKLLEGINISTKDMYEKGRPDFILINAKLDDLKKIFSDDVAKGLAKLLSFIELKSILTESNKEQFKKYKDMVGKEFLVGVAAVVKSSFIDYFPEIKTAMVNIVSLLKELSPEKFMTPEQLKKLSEERMEARKTLESLNKDIDEDKFTQYTKLGDTDQKFDEMEKGQDEAFKKMMEELNAIKSTGEDTNKEVKKKDDEPEVEKDPFG